MRNRPYKRLSTQSVTPTSTLDKSLTSFPSLSPDQNRNDDEAKLKRERTASEELSRQDAVARSRKATLAGLTSSTPSLRGRSALFGDQITSPGDVPGALHLATDEHIERLILRTGAVSLIRQFARDLALRDAEISALRLRADEREKELKRMLREVEVSNQDIERRLYTLENPHGDLTNELVENSSESRPAASRRVTASIDDMMVQAMQDDVGSQDGEGSPTDSLRSDLQATIRPLKNDLDDRTDAQRKRQSLRGGWQDFLWNTVTGSRKTSRASSVISGLEDIGDDTAKPKLPINTARRKGLDETLFQPPETRSFSLNGNAVAANRAVSGDTSSISSRKSNRSISSWTMKIFAGNPSAGSQTVGRSRASSAGQDKAKDVSGTKPLNSAFAALSRINSQPDIARKKAKYPTSAPTGTSGGIRRTAAPSNIQVNGSEAVKSVLPNHGPVEMDAILPEETKPPALSQYNDYQPRDLLCDRFGFIYDQRRKKRERESTTASAKSKSESIKSFRSDGDIGGDDLPEISTSILSATKRSASPNAFDDLAEVATGAKTWQDYLRIATKPTELLSHTPSVGAIVNLTVAAESTTGSPTIADRKFNLAPVTTAPQPEPSPVVATNPEFAGVATATSSASPKRVAGATEQEPVKLLLDQLTDLHDSLQRERNVRWNDFLRKVRAERQKEGEAALASGIERFNKSLMMPEVSLADGEIVGVANLGIKGKVGRAKWKEFKTLVLGGIPVTMRAKVWAECSGANMLRVPGYYDDMVKASQDEESNDPIIVAQIQMDINRTLTDNVFFRRGPGVAKLHEVLLAYARRNPDVGYCQGMNLIAASLLLITPTAEDAFWLLTSIIEKILPEHYYDHGLLTSRADQQVLREYVSEILPKLDAHLEELGIELEAMTFQWFLSVFTDCLSAEALYRVWDVVLCLNATSTTNPFTNGTTAPTTAASTSNPRSASSTSLPTMAASLEDESDPSLLSGNNAGSTFLFQLALALLKLNEPQLIAQDSPAAVYTYINHQMTNHAISIDGLIGASEALRKVVRTEDVVRRRARAVKSMGGIGAKEGVDERDSGYGGEGEVGASI